MANENLLAEFPPVSTEEWEQLIHKELKGADYDKKLVWKTDDGIAVRPYYRREDIANLSFAATEPGEFPYLRGDRATGDWRIREEIPAAAPEEANRMAREAVAAGAEEISFDVSVISNGEQLAQVLDGLGAVPVHLRRATRPVLELVAASHSPTVGCADFDAASDAEFAAKLLQELPDWFRPFTVSLAALEEAGATPAQQLGYGLAAGIEYLDAMTSRGVRLPRAASGVTFPVAIGPSYFLEIAKLRALRLLWSRVVESFGGSPGDCRAVISARTATWNLTVYDPHVNVLRGTTEAMTAAIGGADSITVLPFDTAYEAPTEAARRLARNTQIILKAEAQLARVADPGGGSYYVEVLTDKLARKAWEILQGVEAAGGYAKFKADGKLEAELLTSRSSREDAVILRRRTLLGTNQYPNRAETALERVDPEIMQAGARAALPYEELRLRTEGYVKNGGKNPNFLLAEIGDAKMRAARSSFAANFFGCAGFEVTQKRFDSAEAIANHEADAIVLCSSDAEYAALVESLSAALKQKGRATPVIVAGYPDSAEQLKAAGVADFVHVRSNPIETLTRWQQYFHIGRS